MNGHFPRVLVVGAGIMGGGIAQVVAASGRTVFLHDADPQAGARALTAIRSSLEKLAEKGGGDPDEILTRIEIVDGFREADLMIEAVSEDARLKEAVFAAADEALPESAVLASNTSSIPIATLAAATRRPDRVVGLHFFNPVSLLRLVEVIRTPDTSDDTVRMILELARELGKEPIETRDVPGFAANRILMPFLNEAVAALADGVADAEGIDTAARLGFGHPIGPLELADLIGLDTCVAIMEVLERGLGEPRFAPHPLLREHVAAGRLGRKSGEGFHRYDAKP